MQSNRESETLTKILIKMGEFGKSRVVQFFMSYEDQKRFLDGITGEGIYLIKDTLYPTKKVVLRKSIPNSELKSIKGSRVWFIYNKNMGELSFRYNEYARKYDLILGKSPLIHLCLCVTTNDRVIEGSIGTLLSYKDKNGVETDLPKNFVKWWQDVSKTAKKDSVKCRIFDVQQKRTGKISYQWAAPGAVKLYNKGIVLTQFGVDRKPLVTFIPEFANAEQNKKD